MIASSTRRAPRVLHIVESLDTGAVENWLLRMLKAGKTFDVNLDWTFFSILTKPGKFDDVARALGASVISSKVELDSKLRFVRGLRTAIREGGYDVLHCHHDVVSAVYLTAAAGLPLHRRIVHVHNADLHVPTGSAGKAALLREPMRATCLALADRIVGISNYTLDNFLAGRPRKAARDVVLYYGIDTGPFHTPPPDRAAILRSLDLPGDAKVILFMSRMVSYKNPLFVVDMMAQLAATDPAIHAIFVGTGPLVGAVKNRAAELGVTERVRVVGWRDDGATLMRVADLFVFPRAEEVVDGAAREGLGLVVVEAQAAGLPSLLSHGIPDDAIVNEKLCEVRSLSEGAGAWADAARKILSRDRPDPAASVQMIDASRFSLRAGFDNLVALHRI